MLAFSLLTLTAVGFPAGDEVKILPGWNGNLPSRHFSGYLPVGEGTGVRGSLHYWFIEAESNATNAPVTLWLNGGPGSSSLIGLLQENGQFQTNDFSLNTSGVPELFYNPYSWTQVTNMLYLESPKGVGFSYCDVALQCTNTDESTAIDAYEGLLHFFTKLFPEYAQNDFYITGESYAGIYIPMLMDQISHKGGINLIGAAIGNGCWGNTVGTCAFNSPEAKRINSEFYFGHAMYSSSLHSDILQDCDFQKPPLSPKCSSHLSKMNSAVGSFDVYNIYDTCGNDQLLSPLKTIERVHGQTHLNISSGAASFERVRVDGKGQAVSGNDYVCGADRAMGAYLKHKSVVEALHVKAGTSGMHYSKTAGDLRPLYALLLKKYRVLIYSGDADACVPYFGTETWVSALNIPVVEHWRPWVARGPRSEETIKAGYIVQYEHNFKFLTINGAGHMVPQHKPAQALAMFQHFIRDDGYPRA